MKSILLLLICLVSFSAASAKTIIVTVGGKVPSIQAAAQSAAPGDLIYVQKGVYNGGMSITNLQGTSLAKITILADTTGDVIIRGGSNSIQFTDAKHIILDGFIIEGQTGNGLNMDDGGTLDSRAEYITVRNCTIRNINATGNNDLFKMSGIYYFSITNCNFENGSAGGSGVDMVGCHYGNISENRFINQGSNAIQAKGGTSDIRISRNYFENCGQRTLNLGGSTGLAFFRPIDATYEAADLAIYSNIFIGSVAPICYVGSIRVDVANNTIIRPEKWVIRILQETVDPSRFVPCSQGLFRNNLIYQGTLGTETNVGSNTSPNEFLFSNNFWYNYQNTNWQGPQIPTPDQNITKNQDPMFENPTNDFKLKIGSPAIGKINDNKEPLLDYFGNSFLPNRSAGAIEGGIISSVDSYDKTDIDIYPNPASDKLIVSSATTFHSFEIYSIEGFLQQYGNLKGSLEISISDLQTGTYYICLHTNNQTTTKKFIVK